MIVTRLVTVKSIETDEGNNLETALGRRAVALRLPFFQRLFAERDRLCLLVVRETSRESFPSPFPK